MLRVQEKQKVVAGRARVPQGVHECQGPSNGVVAQLLKFAALSVET